MSAENSLERMDAVDFFHAELEFRTDVSDVWAAMAQPDPGFVLVDSRGEEAWGQARIPGAVHLPTRRIAGRAREMFAPGTPIVTYCWGPGCNGATRAALEFARLGHPVREMLGGIEYWQREGLPVVGSPAVAGPDALTTVVDTIRCDC